MFDVQCDRAARLRLREQLAVLKMPPAKQRRIVMQVAREVRRQSKKNIRTSRTVSGSPMESRKDQRNRRRLLKGLGKGLTVYGRGSKRAEITYPNALTAKIAARQHYGIAERWTRSKAQKVYGKPDYSAPATRQQAKALKDLGYRRKVQRKNGRGSTFRRVPVKWICSNMTQGQAGMVLGILSSRKNAAGVWNVKPAARPFLGVPVDAADAMLVDLARQTLKEMKHA